MVNIDRMYITPDFTDLTGTRRYNAGMDATVHVHFSIGAPTASIEQFLNMEDDGCVNIFQRTFYNYARGVNSDFPYPYVVSLSDIGTGSSGLAMPAPDLDSGEQGFSLMFVIAIGAGLIALALGCGIVCYCICLRNAINKIAPTDKVLTDKELLAELNDTVTRGPEHAWQEDLNIRVSPLRELEEQMKKEQQKVRELEELMKREQQKNKSAFKDLSDWNNSDAVAEPGPQKVLFERSFTQQAANVVKDYQEGADRVSQLREAQRTTQKKRLEERIGKSIELSNPLYEQHKTKTSLLPGSVGVVFEQYDQAVQRETSSRERQRDQQKETLRNRLVRSRSNILAPVQEVESQSTSLEDETRLTKGTCQHCEEPVLATHRRSKVKGGGYVHEWCKPMMKAMRSNSTIQPNKPEPIASIASSPKAPPEDETRPKEVKEKRMCVHCEEPVLATHRRSKVKGGGYVHEWCKPMLKAMRSTLK